MTKIIFGAFPLSSLLMKLRIDLLQQIFPMCHTIQKYQVAVNRFQLEIYPAVQYALEAINTIEAGVLDEQYISAVNNLQKEFHSLETFERKLIFPAVLSLLTRMEKEKQFTPDIAEILNLCIAKKRLSTYVDEIKSMLEGETERESNTVSIHAPAHAATFRYFS